MKHQVPDSLKFKKLQRRLGVSRVTVAGTLELLWIATQKNAPEGDIGRFDNETIAIECDWEGDPTELVDALCDTGWLDRCAVNRLVVHDWPDHAPAWIRRQLTRHGKSFVTVCSSQNVTRDRLDESDGTKTVTDDRLEATRNLTQRNVTQPNVTQPNDCPAEPDASEPPKRKRKAAGEHPRFREWYAAYPRREKPRTASVAFSRAVDEIHGRDGPGSQDAAGFLIERAKAYAESDVGKGDRQFIPHPATWLNAGGYDDDPACWVRAAIEPRKSTSQSNTEAFLTSKASYGVTGMRLLGSEPPVRSVRAPGGTADAGGVLASPTGPLRLASPTSSDIGTPPPEQVPDRRGSPEPCSGKVQEIRSG